MRAAPLRSEGVAGACGVNDQSQGDLTALVADATCTKVAAGVGQAVLLWSDSIAGACSETIAGQCDFPALDASCRRNSPRSPARAMAHAA